MGCCCSSDESNKNDGNKETEMTNKNGNTDTATDDETVLCIARGMSAPTIEIENRTQISGYGLALAAVNIEQDSAYWEVHIQISGDDSVNVLIGLATKKDRKFYSSIADDANMIDNVIDDDDESNKKKYGVEYMSKLNVSNNDIIGVVVQQSDLPMIQFYKNGQQQYDASINRFRGNVYPSFYIPTQQKDNEQQSIIQMKVVFRESNFQQPIPQHNCSPVIVARGLM